MARRFICGSRGLAFSEQSSFMPRSIIMQPHAPQIRFSPIPTSAVSSSNASSQPTSFTSTRRRARPSAAKPSPSRTSSTGSAALRRQIVALFSQAKLAERTGHYEKARHLLHQCLDLNSRDAHSWLALARLEARLSNSNLHSIASDNTPSLPNVDTIKDNDSSATLHENYTDTSLQTPTTKKDFLRRLMVARRTFEQGLFHCPDNLHLLHAWAVHEYRSGDRQRARNLFSQALRIDPGNTYVSHSWGLLEQRVGNIQRARDLYARSAAQRPSAEICVSWAVLEGRDGRIDTARRIFKQAVAAAEASTNPSSLGNAFREWATMEERLGDFPRARDLLSKAIAAHPTNSSAYVALAKLEARRGDAARAVDLVRAAADVAPNPPASVYIAWGHIEWTTCCRPDEARAIFLRGIQRHPRDPALFQSLGTLEDKSGNHDDARCYFRQSITVEPRAPAFVAWAMLEQRLGDIDRARCLFKQAIETDPLHGAAYNAYGMMEARTGRDDVAREVFQQGVNAAASSSLFHGFALFELRVANDVSRARQLFKTGISLSREDTSFLWHSWGMMELAERQTDAACKVFADGIHRYPRNSQLLVGAALTEVAKMRVASGDGASARNYFKRAVAADPTHAQAWQTWAVFELRSGRPDVAVTLFRRGLRLCPSHPALWQAWGVLEAARGAMTRARQLFRRGVEICPANVHLFQAWACLEARAGQISRARELLDAALNADSSHGAVWSAYGVLEARHGSLTKARQVFAAGIRRAPSHAPLFRAYGETELRAGNIEQARHLLQQGLNVDPRHPPLYHALAKLEAIVGNLDALAELKQQAETYFASKQDAGRAIDCGETVNVLGAVTDAQETVESDYGARSTPMELALDGGNIMNT